jgi:superfamily II DNA or RNA helicase
VRLALEERFTLIQGPPGTGKTLIVSALCANWMKNRQIPPRILICAPSNAAADHIAERLALIPSLHGKFLRMYSGKREDIFNITAETLKPNTLMHRIVYLDAE